MRRKTDHLAFQIVSRVDVDTMERLTWYASQRQQPMSVVIRDAIVEYLDTYMNSATRLGEQFREERGEYRRKKAERMAANGS